MRFKVFKDIIMTYKDSEPPQNQVVCHNRTKSDVLLDTFRRPNEMEEKMPLSSEKVNL